MTNNEKNRQQFVTALLHFLYPDSRSDDAEERRLLNESGYDYDSLSGEGTAFARDLVRKEMKIRAQERRANLLTALKSELASIRAKGPVFKTLAEFLNSSGSDMQLAFHKLEGLTETELQAIIAELSALKQAKDSETSSND